MTNQDPNNLTPPAAPVKVAAPPTVSEQIWSEIKSREILMFALPGQKVSDFCTPVPIDPTRCFLVTKASATLPALEEAIGPDYECTSAEKYIIISRKQKNSF